MSGEIVTTEQRALTVADLKQRVDLHKQVQKEVMKEGIHYGTIPGCGDKKTLLKPGYELLLLTFNLGITFDIEDLSGDDIVHYRTKSRIINLATGRIICEGVGEASSEEEKYKWKKVVCDAEWDEYDSDRKRLKWKKKKYVPGQPASYYQEKQIRTNPADVANTILKMSKKRCGTDGTITATGCSDIYAQDMEGDGEQPPKPPMSPPQSKSEAGKKQEGEACPSCGNMSAVIESKPEYGGGYVCYKKKGGCGHKWGGDSNTPDTPEDELKKDMREIQAKLVKFDPKLKGNSEAKRDFANQALKVKFPDMDELKSMSDLTPEYAKELISHLDDLLEMKKGSEG
jgi:hypothetical protein